LEKFPFQELAFNPTRETLRGFYLCALPGAPTKSPKPDGLGLGEKNPF
jgi:hypothetical protein